MEVALLQNKLKDVFLTFYVHFLQKQGYKVEIEEGKQRGGEKPFIQVMLEALLDAILITIVIIIGIMKGNMGDIDEYIRQIQQDPDKMIREIKPADLLEAEEVINDHEGTAIKKQDRITESVNVNRVVDNIFEGGLPHIVDNLGKMGAAIENQEKKSFERPTHPLLLRHIKRFRSTSPKIKKGENFDFGKVYDDKQQFDFGNKQTNIEYLNPPSDTNNTEDPRVEYADVYKKSQIDLNKISYKPTNPLKTNSNKRWKSVSHGLYRPNNVEEKEGGSNKRKSNKRKSNKRILKKRMQKRKSMRK